AELCHAHKREQGRRSRVAELDGAAISLTRRLAADLLAGRTFTRRLVRRRLGRLRAIADHAAAVTTTATVVAAAVPAQRGLGDDKHVHAGQVAQERPQQRALGATAASELAEAAEAAALGGRTHQHV